MADPTQTLPPPAAPLDEATIERRNRLLAEARDAVQAGDHLRAVDAFMAANRIKRSTRIERRLVKLRHQAFDTMDRPAGRSEWPPSYPDPFEGCTEPPEISRDELTADVLGGAIVHHGCLLVRGLLGPDQVKQMTRTIDRCLDGYDAKAAGATVEETVPWFEMFEPNERYKPFDIPGERNWLRPQGSMYAGDSPRALFDLIDNMERSGIREVLTGYLGERPALALKKSSLRRVPVDGGSSWHQDGAFLGNGIRTTNVWVTLTRCGEGTDSPGLEIVPRRIDHIVETGSHGALFDWAVGDGVVDKYTDHTIRPTFEAGDALLFDDLFLHQSFLTPEMTRARYALETWFFAPSAYPDDNIPIVF